MIENSHPSNAAAIIAAAVKLGQLETQRPERTSIGNLDVLIAQNGAITSLEKFADAPRRKRADLTIYEPASFIDYLNRHRLPRRTIIFGKCTETAAGFTAIIDYHGEEPAPVPAVSSSPALEIVVSSTPPAAASLAAWGVHRATLNLVTTPEWRRWIENNAKHLPQEAFAEFIEDNLTDIVRPDAATLLELAQGLQGKKNVAFKSGKNLRDGSIQLEYVESIEVQGTTTRREDNFRLPDKFTLGIVPFIGADGIEIEARLRFRIGENGKLTFCYLLNRPYQLIEQAFLSAREDIEKGTGIRVLLGTGEIAPAA